MNNRNNSVARSATNYSRIGFADSTVIRGCSILKVACTPAGARPRTGAGTPAGARPHMRTTETSFTISGLALRPDDWKDQVLALFSPDDPTRVKLEQLRLPIPLMRSHGSTAGSNLVSAYRAEYTARYRRDSQYINLNKYHKAIDDCTRELIQADITPTAWISYSFSLWVELNTQRRNSPPHTWMFSRLRVKKYADACRKQYTGASTVVWPVSARELLYRWSACWDDIWLSQCYDSRSSVSALVSKHWPRSQFDTLLRRAVQDCEKTRGTAAM